MPKQFQYCRVCRLNHNQGKGHRYAVKHNERLSQLLSKALQKIQEVLFFVKNVSRLREEDRVRNKFWCYFCEQEICEKQSVFACESIIQHLASLKHATSVKTFWSEQGADIAKRHLYILSNEDLVKWDEACEVLEAAVAKKSGRELDETNNIHSDACPFPEGSTFGLGSRNILAHVASVDAVQPLSVLTVGRSQNFGPANGGPLSLAAATSSQPWLPRLGEEGTSSFPNVWCVSGESALQEGSGQPRLPETAIAVPISLKEAIGMDASLRSSPKVFSGGWSGGTVEHTSATDCMVLQSRQTTAVDKRGNGQVHKGRLQRSDANGNSQSAVSSMANAMLSRQTESAFGENMTSIRPSPLQPGEGNIHSGALPPWLKRSDDGQVSQANSVNAIPSMPQLSRTHERKLAKLRNPNRVGAAWAEQRRAEIEREQRGETNKDTVQQDVTTWLPSFGRVWQSGSRRDTRKEFEAEKRRESIKLGRPLGKRGANSTLRPAEVQPYVSKRQRLEHRDN